MFREAFAGFLCHLAEQAADAAWNWLASRGELEEDEPEPEPWWTRTRRTQ